MMFLVSIRIKNYRSIVDSEDIRIERLQALVGENGAGKSNILTAINAFLSAGAGGIKEQNFYNINEPIVIMITFTHLTEEERKSLRRYLIGDKLILEKHVTFVTEGKTKISSEYHGYIANPTDWWLSTEGVNGEKGAKPNWKAIAEEHNILEYVQTPEGKVSKKSYGQGLERLLLERDDIEYGEPVLGETQALGYPSVLLKHLPQFYLLPAITDYSDEIDRRSSSTVFHKLMGDLGDRIIKQDPKYKEIEEALAKIDTLLNPNEQSEAEDANGGGRLEVLGTVETELRDSIRSVMPSVNKVSLKIELEGTRELFSRGVKLGVDDGKITDVLDKGHGLQRCVVFGLLKTLIKHERGGLVSEEDQLKARPIILAIEEPELYIHPQLQRLVYGVLKTFASTTGTHDQVIYSTHSPAFVDVWDYYRIGVVRKERVEIGTKVHQCETGVLGNEQERKGFQLLNSFGIDKNHIFFAKRTIIVEGSQDSIAIIATGRNLGIFQELPEEIEYSIVVADGKGNVPKFQKLLNAFKLPYVVLLELDGKPETDVENKAILDQIRRNNIVKYPSKLEVLAGKNKHFDNDYQAKVFFSKAENLTAGLKQTVKALFANTE